MISDFVAILLLFSDFSSNMLNILNGTLVSRVLIFQTLVTVCPNSSTSFLILFMSSLAGVYLRITLKLRFVGVEISISDFEFLLYIGIYNGVFRLYFELSWIDIF